MQRSELDLSLDPSLCLPSAPGPSPFLSVAQISLLLCLSLECRVSLLIYLFLIYCQSIYLSVSQSPPWTLGLSTCLYLGQWVILSLRNYVYLLVFQTQDPGSAFLFLETGNISLSLGCQESLPVPLGIGSARWSVCQSLGCLVHLLVCCSARGSVCLPVFWLLPCLARLSLTRSLSVCLRLSHPQLLHLSVLVFPSVFSPLSTPPHTLGQKHSSFQRRPRSCSIQEHRHPHPTLARTADLCR